VSDQEQDVNATEQETGTVSSDRQAPVEGQGSEGGAKGPQWENYVSAVKRFQKKVLDRLESLEEKFGTNGTPQDGQNASESRYATSDANGYQTQEEQAKAWEDFVSQIVDKRMSSQRITSEQDEALKYVDSLQGIVQTEEDEEELMGIMTEYGMDHKRNPLKSVKAAVEIFKGRHGISGGNSSAERMAAGIQGSSKAPSGSNGGKTWTIADLSKKTPEELKSLMPELQKAYKDGRIKS